MIEFSQVDEIDDPDGVLISVSCRTNEYDFLVIYVPNIPLFGLDP